MTSEIIELLSQECHNIWSHVDATLLRYHHCIWLSHTPYPHLGHGHLRNDTLKRGIFPRWSRKMIQRLKTPKSGSIGLLHCHLFLSNLEQAQCVFSFWPLTCRWETTLISAPWGLAQGPKMLQQPFIGKDCETAQDLHWLHLHDLLTLYPAQADLDAASRYYFGIVRALTSVR